jgi:hypothetical protein
VSSSTVQGRAPEYANGPGSSTRKLPSGLVAIPEASVSWRSPRPSGRMAKICPQLGLAPNGSQLEAKTTAFVTDLERRPDSTPFADRAGGSIWAKTSRDAGRAPPLVEAGELTQPAAASVNGEDLAVSVGIRPQRVDGGHEERPCPGGVHEPDERVRIGARVPISWES